jgi:hypothetical protein
MFWSAGMRFVVIMDPACQWLVYDEVVGVPAERDGELLVAPSREAAKRLASEANFAWAVEMLRHVGPVRTPSRREARARRRPVGTSLRNTRCRSSIN